MGEPRVDEMGARWCGTPTNATRNMPPGRGTGAEGDRGGPGCKRWVLLKVHRGWVTAKEWVYNNVGLVPMNDKAASCPWASPRLRETALRRQYE